jgi:pimeloyl-ACP methyl ester carboxylesterase
VGGQGFAALSTYNSLRMNPPNVQYATTSDGINIAFGASGAGRPLIFLPLTFSHVQLSWTEETNLLQWLRGLSERFRVIQYDGRGQGMSTRGLTDTHGGAHEVLDLEAVIERQQLERFILMARSWHAARWVTRRCDTPPRIPSGSKG